MCGIAGLFDFSNRLSRDELRHIALRMAKTMTHRGPDDEGVWVDPEGHCALAHRRLSIIDTSSAGRQPMESRDGQHVLTFNGELYNYLELRPTLEAAGETFHTRTDTEVFLAGLRRDGNRFLSRADSMFALGLYDRKNRELLLARDPFGEKPLYYTECNGLFAFASELHALMEVPGFDARISLGAIGNYLTFQHIPAPFTIYDSCRKVAPGHFLRVTPFGVGHQTPYFHFLTTSEPTSRTLDEQADELEEILLRSLRRRLLSDVPLGAFLSGGIDSSTAVALMTQKLNRSIQTFSVGFKDTPESEHVLASQIASHLGTDHTEAMFDPADYVRAVDIAARTDEPNGDSSCIPTNLVSQVARRSVTVAITGDGADELFGGYHRYFDCMMASAKRADDIALGRFHVGADYYSRRVLVFDDNDLRQFFGEIPRSTQDLLLEKRSRIDLDARPLLNRLREADAANYLPEVLAKVDRMSMLHGLEARTPYLSQEVAAFAARLPPERLREGPRGKIVLRQITKRYLPNDWVERPKRGFGIEPFHAAALPPLLERTQRELADGDCALAAFLPPEHLRHFTTAVLPKMNFYHAWSLLFLELWLRSHPHHPQMPLQGS